MSSFADIGRLLLYQTPKSCDSVLIRGRLLLEPPLVPNFRREPTRKDRLRLYGAFESVEICKGIIIVMIRMPTFDKDNDAFLNLCSKERKNGQVSKNQKIRADEMCASGFLPLNLFHPLSRLLGWQQSNQKKKQEYLTKKQITKPLCINSINRECFAH